MSKYTFKSIDGTGVINCDNLDLVRPFKVMIELQAQSGPNISGTKYYARICEATTTTMELYKDLDKAMQVSEETYDQIIKLKQVWCEHQVLTGKISPFAVTPGMVPERCPKQVPDQLEEFLLKARGLKEWPTSGIPIHWHIVVKDEAWFNELAHLHQNEDPNKGDFTEIHFVPGFLIKLAGWRDNVMFTLPLCPEPVYTIKEGLEKISEFIIAGKIEIPGFKYN